MDDPTIIAAIITAVASLIVAIFGLVTSGKAKHLASKAEEASKRSDQVRSRATAAGEELLTAMAEVIIKSETVSFLLSNRTVKALTEEETGKYVAPLGPAVSQIRRIMYATAIYTTPTIRKNINNVLRPFLQPIDFSMWETLVVSLLDQHSAIAGLFRDTYLKIDNFDPR